MTKNEYLTQLRDQLKKNNVADTEDIISEYEQHFAFKLADGFSEDEIAAKLGSPQTIAAQFNSETKIDKSGSGGRVFVKIAMSFAALFEAMVYILFFCWVVVVAATSLASAVIGVCLIGHLNVYGLLPNMPYLSALIFGICFFAFAVLLAAASYYFFAYTRQIIRASIRWHRNMTSSTALPPLSWSPQFTNKTRRTLRAVLLWSVTIFGVSFALAFIVSELLSGALGFWHAWHWFVR